MNAPAPPIALLAELTYRCPLRCGYCSNPTDWRSFQPELDTATWSRVMAEAAALGVLHAHLSGGEPLLRDDLEPIARAARDAGLYVNLITSARGLTRPRLEGLAAAGVDHVQVSVQDLDAPRADLLAGTEAHEHKLRACAWVKELGLALSLNVVLHRANIDRTGGFIALAEALGAERIELANTQFHGSAFAHRDTLRPTGPQLLRNAEVARQEAGRLRGRCDVLWVLSDWYADAPRPCTDGWGRRFITVIPDGTALPCAGAHALPGLARDNVRTRDLATIWREGADFNRFRGESWMPEPCASCERRDLDHGGCRCQAFALTGNAAATDPACPKSPDHGIVRASRLGEAHPDPPPVVYRLDLSRRPR